MVEPVKPNRDLEPSQHRNAVASLKRKFSRLKQGRLGTFGRWTMRIAERPRAIFLLTLLTLLVAAWIGIQQLLIMQGQERRELERIGARPEIEVSIPNHWAQQGG